MILNSEIRKYFWQDFSLQRMIAMPAVLSLILLFITLTANKNEDRAIVATMLFIYFIIILFWGGYKAACAVIEEVKDNTWDYQKLSSVSPWSLTFGKLFGSTLYNWYGGIIILAILGFYSLYSQSILQVSYNLIMLVLVGVFCHAVALLASIQSLRTQRSYKRLHTVSYLIIALTISMFFFPSKGSLYGFPIKSYMSSTTHWFHFEVPETLFLLVSLSCFLFWTVIAIYRLMREELKFRNIPWVWGLFVIFAMIYVTGFIFNPHKYSAGSVRFLSGFSLGMAFTFGVISIYLMYFADTINITRYRILWNSIKSKNLIKSGESLPRWVVSFVITFIVGGVICISELVQNGVGVEHVIVSVITLLLFVLRDACILHYFKFAVNNQRASLATLFYLSMLYILVPALFMAAESKFLAKMFFPAFHQDNSYIDIIPAIIHVGLAGGLLYWRWNKVDKEMS